MLKGLSVLCIIQAKRITKCCLHKLQDVITYLLPKSGLSSSKLLGMQIFVIKRINDELGESKTFGLISLCRG